MRGPLDSLRALVLVMGLCAATYVGAVVAYLGAVILPTTSALEVRTRALQATHDAIERRAMELTDAVMAVEAVLRVTRDRRPGATPLPADGVADLLDMTNRVAEGETALDLADRIALAPDEVREALAVAAGAEASAVQLVASAARALADGDLERAAADLASADDERVRAQSALNSARAGVIDAILVQEQALAGTSRRAVRMLAAWGVLGTALLAVGILVLRRRVYQPMERLQLSLEGVAKGELETRLDLTGVDELGRLGEMFNTMTDVLRTRESERRLAHPGSIERYSRILEDSASELIALDASTFTVIEANGRALEHLGYSPAALERLHASELWEAEGSLVTRSLEGLRAGAYESGDFVARQRRADGSTYPVEVTVYRAPDHDPPAIIALAHDLTERERLERVHEQLARFALGDQIILEGGDTERAVRSITELAASTLGVRRASVWLFDEDAIVCADLYDAETNTHARGQRVERADAPRYFSALEGERTIAADDARHDPRTSELAEGYLVPENVWAMLDAPVRLRHRMFGVACHEHVGGPRSWTAEERVLAGGVADLVMQVLEVAERQRAEQSLLESERRYRAVFEQAAVGMAETNAHGRLLRANPRLLEMLRYSPDDLRKLTWTNLVQPEDRAALVAGLDGLRSRVASSFQHECRCRRKDGTEISIELTVSPIESEDEAIDRLIIVASDMTEARSLQAQLIHSQRMESIGRLAGGIAHDFNNILTAILGHTELAGAEIDDSSPAFVDLQGIEESALRASGLTRQLLTFARRQVVEPRVVELDTLTSSAQLMLRRMIGEEVELETDLGAEGASIRVDPGQYEQVVMNLAVNARDAMPGGGRLRISTRVVEVGDQDAGLVDLTPGTYAELAVRDWGTGMTPEVRERLFEPFFTTKPAGQGTGLGLATCYGIIGQAGGRIEVESAPGQGSVFRILLPRVSQRPASAEAQAEVKVDARGTETVLVAEDEDAVRRLVVESLSRRGYTVLSGEDGPEALSVAADHEGPIDALVTDIVMPKMRGPEVAARLRETRPHVKVLFVSGYSGSADTADAMTTNESAFLAKPFTPTELTARVRALLDGLPW